MALADKIGGGYHTPTIDDQTSGVFTALQQQYPGLINLLNQGTDTQANAQLATAKEITPGYNDLALSELQRTAPQVAAITQQQNAGQAAGDIANLNQYGAAAGTALRNTDSAANPEFYQNLALTGQKMTDALNAQSPGLSAGVQAEVERGANRINPNGSPGSADTAALKNQQFGQAGQAQVNNFTNAINSISANLGNLKTGLNPANVAQGHTASTSQAAGAVQPIVNPSASATQTGNSLLDNIFGTNNNLQGIAAGKFRTWGDALHQDSESFKNIAGGAASLGA